jgi:hypothetical protein
MGMHRWSFTTAGASAVLAVGAIVVGTALPGFALASHGAIAAADAAARAWAADVPASARLGAEPAGRCRRVDDRHAACPIAIVVLAHDSAGRRPFRCSANVRVSRTADRVAGQRTDTRCRPFPPLTDLADPLGALGTAFALSANGDVTCLPANAGRVTCVMRYPGPAATRCFGAASVPRARLERSVALGPPVCVARAGQGA